MSKKILSVMLALVLVLSTFAVSAFAAVGVAHEEEDAETGIIENTQVWSLEAAEEADANGYYAVTVSLKTNYDAVSAISFVLNVEGATLVDYVCNIDATADIVADNDTGLVNIYPMPASAGVAAYDFTAGAVVATLYYELNGDSATITLNNDAKCYDNPDGKLFAVRTSDGKLAGSAIYGQRVVDAEGADIALDDEIASVTIGAAVADPVLKGAHDAIIINTNQTCGGAYAGTIYGFTGNRWINASYLNNQLTVENGTMTPVANATGKWGTGSTVEVYNLNNEKVATYVVVIFGDLDGSGQINNSDITVFLDHFNSISKLTAGTPVFMAANLYSSFVRLTNNDLTVLLDHRNSVAAIDQNAIGAKHTYSN